MAPAQVKALAVSDTEAAVAGRAGQSMPGAISGQCVAFQSSDRSYAVDIMSVQEIRSWSETMFIPGQHPASNGVMDIRGEVVEVYDLGALLGGERTDPTEGHVVLVLTLGARIVGILVDAVSDIIQIEADALQPPPGSVGRGMKQVVKGIVTHQDRMVALLDLDPAIGSAA